MHVIYLVRHGRTQISYRAITPYSVDSLLFTSGKCVAITLLWTQRIMILLGVGQPAFRNDDRQLFQPSQCPHYNSLCVQIQ